MTREETAAILKTLRLAYPNFYGRMKIDDMRDTLALWSTMFAEDDPRLVTAAVQDLIKTHSGFPPDIADVKNKLRDMIASVTGEPTDEDLWLILVEALKNGYYGADEEFEKLPPILKRWCGSASRIRDLSQTDTTVLDSVVHGQFLRQITAMRSQQDFAERLSPELSQYIGSAFKRLPEGGGKTPEELEESRNRVLNALKGGY